MSERSSRDGNIFKVTPLNEINGGKHVRINTEICGPNTIRTQHESNVTIGSG